MTETTSGTPVEWLFLPTTAGPSVEWTEVTVTVAEPSPEAPIYYGATSPNIRPAGDPDD
jgi:hypothetical protein